MSRIRCFVVAQKGRLPNLDTLDETLAAWRGGRIVWIDLEKPERADLDALAEPLGLHPLAIEDCLDEDQVPKIEAYTTHTFLIFNSFRYAEGYLEVHEIDAFVGKGFLLTVHRGPGTDVGLMDSAAAEHACLEKGADFLLHAVMDHVVDRKLGAIEGIQDEIDLVEDRILGDIATFQPQDLLRLRRSLLALRKSLFHEREILVRICRGDSPWIGERAVVHFRDVYDHLARYFEVTEIGREMIANLMEIYLSMLNNRMAALANRTNRVMRRLTVIMTVFMPLTLLAGICGMSEWTMMTGGPDHWRLAYPAFLLGMGAIGFATYRLLGWIDRRADPAGESSGA
ncbi:MAG: magnesium transporter CorA family protein [Deltaproteobacteria bacterium]|nr:magnesium transporter CorA family protein [Deltaproteobacteria bacterium]